MLITAQPQKDIRIVRGKNANQHKWMRVADVSHDIE